MECASQATPRAKSKVRHAIKALAETGFVVERRFGEHMRIVALAPQDPAAFESACRLYESFRSDAVRTP